MRSTGCDWWCMPALGAHTAGIGPRPAYLGLRPRSISQIRPMHPFYPRARPGTTPSARACGDGHRIAARDTRFVRFLFSVAQYALEEGSEPLKIALHANPDVSSTGSPRACLSPTSTLRCAAEYPPERRTSLRIAAPTRPEHSQRA